MRLLVIAISTVFFAGCGTISNKYGMDGFIMGEAAKVRPRIFGGVADDLEWTRDAYWLAKPLCLLDIPASLVGDVLTLPAIHQWQRDFDEWQKEKDSAPTPDAPSESNCP